MSLEAQTLSIADQHEYHGQPFPLALEVSAGNLDDACAWARDHAAELDALPANRTVRLMVRAVTLAARAEAVVPDVLPRAIRQLTAS